MCYMHCSVEDRLEGWGQRGDSGQLHAICGFLRKCNMDVGLLQGRDIRAKQVGTMGERALSRNPSKGLGPAGWRWGGVGK